MYSSACIHLRSPSASSWLCPSLTHLGPSALSPLSGHHQKTILGGRALLEGHTVSPLLGLCLSSVGKPAGAPRHCLQPSASYFCTGPCHWSQAALHSGLSVAFPKGGTETMKIACGTPGVSLPGNARPCVVLSMPAHRGGPQPVSWWPESFTGSALTGHLCTPAEVKGVPGADPTASHTHYYRHCPGDRRSGPSAPHPPQDLVACPTRGSPLMLPRGDKEHPCQAKPLMSNSASGPSSATHQLPDFWSCGACAVEMKIPRLAPSFRLGASGGEAQESVSFQYP